VAVPTVMGLPLTGEILSKVLPLLPVVLLYAAINAFNEEIYYRTTLLSTLPQVVGRRHALMMNVMFFGMTHYLYGAPPGILGFALTGFLGWLLGKSMLETKGLFWPWMIHFLPDIVVFLSYAILWLNA
jgi:membrane protease YdiL (CAAX protease family)